MATLARDRKVLELARDLGLPARRDPVAAILRHALGQVDLLFRSSPIPIDSLETLRRVVANKFRAKIEIIEDDTDVHRIAAENVDFSPYLHQQLAREFLEGTTEGVTVERESYTPLRSRFLVIADGRIGRRARVYFTVWHELSHLLVHPTQLAFPGFRRTAPPEERAKDPLEQVVDHVAGHVAFFEPLFRLPAETAMATHGGATFAAIEDARERAGIPRASLYAAAMRTILYTRVPTALVTVDLVLKPSERRCLRPPQTDLGLALPPTPTPQLRLTGYVANRAAESGGLEIWRHMRVPAQSALARAFLNESDGLWVASEDQSWWGTSEKGLLPSLPLRVEALRRGRFVYGLISVRV